MLVWIAAATAAGVVPIDIPVDADIVVHCSDPQHLSDVIGGRRFIEIGDQR